MSRDANWLRYFAPIRIDPVADESAERVGESMRGVGQFMFRAGAILFGARQRADRLGPQAGIIDLPGDPVDDALTYAAGECVQKAHRCLPRPRQ